MKTEKMLLICLILLTLSSLLKLFYDVCRRFKVSGEMFCFLGGSQQKGQGNIFILYLHIKLEKYDLHLSYILLQAKLHYNRLVINNFIMSSHIVLNNKDKVTDLDINIISYIFFRYM